MNSHLASHPPTRSLGYFVSDLHLIDEDDPKTKVFLRFLKRLAESPDGSTLFLVGDIFDLWVGGHRYFRDRFPQVLTAVQNLVAKGVEVHFFEGNHDLHLKSFWEGELGVIVHPDAAFFEIAGRKVRVEHGDLINPDDRGYLFLRRFLRTGLMRWLALHLPDRLVSAIGERASRVSRHHTSTAKELPQVEIRRLIRQHAANVYNQTNFDLIITGHVHVVDDFTFEVDNVPVRSVNLGSWFDEPRVFEISTTCARLRAVEDFLAHPEMSARP